MTDYAKPIRRSDPKTYTPHYLEGFEVIGFESDEKPAPVAPLPVPASSRPWYIGRP